MIVNGYLQTAQIETFTSSTLPVASKYVSRAVYTSDTKQFLISNGTAWLPSPITSGTAAAQPSASTSYLYQLYFQTDTGILQICKLVTATPTWVSMNTTLKLPTVQAFTSSGTYTPTSGSILYVKITAIGAGGGGGGSGSSGPGNGTAGTSTVVGSIITCTGGGYGFGGGLGGGGTGGTATVTTSGTVIKLKAYSGGIGGNPGNENSSLTYNSGGAGGISPFYSAGNFSAAAANSGAGGAGGPASGTPVALGSGGGAGGWCEVLCTNPSSLSGATITIGAGGSAGTAGTSGNPGYAGGSGYVLVEEFYQ